MPRRPNPSKTATAARKIIDTALALEKGQLTVVLVGDFNGARLACECITDQLIREYPGVAFVVKYALHRVFIQEREIRVVNVREDVDTRRLYGLNIHAFIHDDTFAFSSTSPAPEAVIYCRQRVARNESVPGVQSAQPLQTPTVAFNPNMGATPAAE